MKRAAVRVHKHVENFHEFNATTGHHVRVIFVLTVVDNDSNRRAVTWQ